MIYQNLLLGTNNAAYIAGTADGIVTVAGQAAQRDIVLLDAVSLAVCYRTASLQSGHYLITNLDPTKEYLIICRDHEKQYEPFCYDYVKPATDLTVAEQQALWNGWQTSSTSGSSP